MTADDVLEALDRLRSRNDRLAKVDEISDETRGHYGEVASELAALLSDGLVRCDPGYDPDGGGWGLTERGQTRLDILRAG